MCVYVYISSLINTATEIQTISNMWDVLFYIQEICVRMHTLPVIIQNKHNATVSQTSLIHE
jgi:hypothetical protein